MRYLILLLLLGLGGFGCGPGPEPLDPQTEVILGDVAYGPHARQKMDVYLPKGRTPSTKLIVYLHGGGWFQGDKGEIRDAAIFFQQQGFAFLAFNYRLTRTPENFVHPAQMQDLTLALDLVRDQAAQWGITDQRVALFGGSAGGHLALLYAYAHDPARRVKAAISVAGPTDLTDPDLNRRQIGGASVGGMIADLMGCPLATCRPAWQAASPLAQVGGGGRPTLFIHGTADDVVPFAQSQVVHERLRQAGVSTQLIPLPGVGHDLVGADWGVLTPAIIQFINVQVK
jgi:acetyl esterase/lipase